MSAICPEINVVYFVNLSVMAFCVEWELMVSPFFVEKEKKPHQEM